MICEFGFREIFKLEQVSLERSRLIDYLDDLISDGADPILVKCIEARITEHTDVLQENEFPIFSVTNLTRTEKEGLKQFESGLLQE